MNIAGIAIIIFFISIALIELLRHLFRFFKELKGLKVKKRINKYTYTQSTDEDLGIIKRRIYSNVPVLDRLLHSINLVKALDRLTTQANVNLPIGFFLLAALLLGMGGYWGVAARTHNPLMAVLTAVCGIVSPFAFLNIRKKERIKKFQVQLPEGLDLIARSLRAGHAFTSGMKLAADEFPDPLGTEFQETIEEINFGVSPQKALKDMVLRIDCPEIRYFVVAVILQRETGGNLAEILEGLAELMREKVKFEGKVKALAAEGKITAVILVLTPFLMALYLELNTPGYLKIFFTHPIGRMMLYGCSGLMMAGIIVLRRMVDIKV